MANAEGFLIDLDGTLTAAGRALPGAAEMLRAMAGRFMVVSNNSTDVATGLARKLQRCGLPVSAGQLLVAGELAVRWLADHRPGAHVLVLGSPTLVRLARHLGLRGSDEAPDIVLLARDTRFDYRRLSHVANLLRAGAELMVTNDDATHPLDDRGRVVPETGALLQAVMACAGVAPAMRFGKPQPTLLRVGLQRLGIAPGAALLIGDNPATDALGARRLGIPYLLLGTTPDCHAAGVDALMEYGGSASGGGTAWPETVSSA